MRYSTIFGKTLKNSKEFPSKNATLLVRAGFVDQTMAGVYTFLPLGFRVLKKIEDIIRKEMNMIASELLMPAIVPKELWQTTGRLDTVDVLMKTSPANEKARQKNDNEYVLNSTHEDVVTPLIQKFISSYKDFPVAVYHIQTKFRNEPRAKSGLLRCREFRMKDLYSFHTSEEDLKKYYENAKISYMNVFNNLGLGDDTRIVLASGGDFTKDFSHEFQTRCEAGEDTVFYSKKDNLAFNREIAPSQAPTISYSNSNMQPLKEVEGKGIIGVKEIAQFLSLPIEQTTKTLLFETDTGESIVAAVRGGYDVNEEKLKKIVGCKSIKLASKDTVKSVTGAEVGYLGVLNLPKNIRVFMDESMKGRINFEMGANKTNYHTINVNFDRDLETPNTFYDIKTAKEGDIYPPSGEVYEVYKAAEVGNIFPLNTKFSSAFKYLFVDKDGKQKPVYMGSYGIGPSRVMGVLVEKFHDEKGIIWPEQVAPYRVHLIGLDLSDAEMVSKADKLYDQLIKEHVEVLYDDRKEVAAGAKFADADLIGIPHRIVISERTGDKIEYKKRSEHESRLISIEELSNAMQTK